MNLPHPSGPNKRRDPLGLSLAPARRGFRVLLVRGKFPTNHRGVTDASSDPDRIRELFQQRTAATEFLPPDGAAVAGGHDGLGVLDVDPRHRGGESLAELEASYGELPPSWTVETPSGGWHLYFRTPEPQRTRTGFRPGLDLRGAGGYGVAWGPGYRPSPRPIAPCPDWLLAILNPPARAPIGATSPTMPAPRYVERALELECQAVASAPEGVRNDTLNKAAFALSRFCLDGLLDPATICGELERAALQAGLHPREITKTIGSAFRGRGVAA